MVKLMSGHFYRFPRGNVARADVAQSGWWQLTEITDRHPGPNVLVALRTWGIAPSGAFYEGPVITTTDGGTSAGSALAFHQDSLIEVVRSDMDARVNDAYLWLQAPAAIA